MTGGKEDIVFDSYNERLFNCEMLKLVRFISRSEK